MTLEQVQWIYGFRLVCGAISVVAYAGLLWRGYAFAKRSSSRRRRIFWTTALLTLGHWVGILFASSVYLAAHPPLIVALDPVPAVFQTYLAAAVAVGGVILWRLCPRPEDG